MADVINALKAAQRNTDPPAAFDLDESIRRGRRRLRRRRVATIGGGVALVGAVGAGALLMPGGSPDLPELAAEPTFAVLDEPQQEADRLPPSMRQRAGGVDQSSTRLIGEYADLRYWLATNDEGQTCVVGAEDGRWLSTGCGGGNWLGSSHRTTGHGIVAVHVFADDMELGIARHAGFTVISDNLAISIGTSSREREELAGVLESAAEYFSVFTEPQRPADRLPDARNRPDWTVQEATTRYLGELRNVRYWIGAVKGGPPEEHLQICITGVTAEAQWRGTSCSDPLNVSDGWPNWPLRSSDPEDSTQVALVPDDYELTDEQANNWERIAPNLYHDTAAE